MWFFFFFFFLNSFETSHLVQYVVIKPFRSCSYPGLDFSLSRFLTNWAFTCTGCFSCKEMLQRHDLMDLECLVCNRGEGKKKRIRIKMKHLIKISQFFILNINFIFLKKIIRIIFHSLFLH